MVSVNGRATFHGLCAPYLMTLYDNQVLVWGIPVNLKPGANSITPSPANMATVKRSRASLETHAEIHYGRVRVQVSDNRTNVPWPA